METGEDSVTGLTSVTTDDYLMNSVSLVRTGCALES
jgi:hypothetical protein